MFIMLGKFSSPLPIITLVGIIFTVNISLFTNPVQYVFSDGLFEEMLPPASVGDREASLYTKISPPILTSESKGNAYFQLRLFDAKTDKTIEHVSYFIAVEKDGKLLMRDLFHSHQGNLTIKIDPKQADFVSIFGSTEPFLGGWTSETGDISVSGPLLLEGGLYHFTIEIFGIDNDRNIFKPEDAPKFDSWLSVGDIYKNNITFNQVNYNTTIISYYDQVQNFSFNPQEKRIAWEMPFDWNLSRIQDQNIFVHEEVKIPKTFEEFSKARSFDANASEIRLTGRSIVLDPFTEEKNMIIHLLLNKQDIIKIGEKVQNSTGQFMTFSLSPSEQKILNTTSETVADRGGIQTVFEWPKNILSNKELNLKLSFSDALSAPGVINGDINYDISFYDQNQKKVIDKRGLVAKNATDTQTFKFPVKGVYQVEVKINAIKYPNISSPDETRNGVVRGIVVVS